MSKEETHELKLIEPLTNIKFIQCNSYCSFAITMEGLVYSWGYSQYNQLGHNIVNKTCLPKLINIKGIKTLCLSPCNTYFLNEQGEIYYCGYQYLNFNVTTPIKLTKHKFESLSSVQFHHDEAENIFDLNSISCADDGKHIYILRNGTTRKTRYKKLTDYFMKTYNITHSTINRSNVALDYNPDDMFERFIIGEIENDYNIKKRLFSSRPSGEFRYCKIQS